MTIESVQNGIFTIIDHALHLHVCLSFGCTCFIHLFIYFCLLYVLNLKESLHFRATIIIRKSSQSAQQLAATLLEQLQ